MSRGVDDAVAAGAKLSIVDVPPRAPAGASCRDSALTDALVSTGVCDPAGLSSTGDGCPFVPFCGPPPWFAGSLSGSALFGVKLPPDASDAPKRPPLSRTSPLVASSPWDPPLASGNAPFASEDAPLVSRDAPLASGDAPFSPSASPSGCSDAP